MLISPTQQAIYDMLCENTGMHILDSGGANGRAWQKNSAHPIEDFINTPDVYIKSGMVTVDLFHHFDELLVIEERGTNLLHEFASTIENAETWLEIIESWIDSLDGSVGQSYYTYNGENMFSQDFIGTLVTVEIPPVNEYDCSIEDDYIIIQSHNGADARGGFSSPRIFRMSDGMNDTFRTLYEQVDANCVSCSAWFTTSDGYTWEPNFDSEPTNDPDEDASQLAERIYNSTEEFGYSEYAMITCPRCNDGSLDFFLSPS